jgi:helix-turn-helix protein
MHLIKQLTTALLIFLCTITITSCSDLNSEDYDEQYFKIRMHYDFNNEVNTFSNQLQKDLALDGVVTIEFYFETEELFRIEEMVFLIDFFALQDTIHQASSDSTIYETPNPGTQFLRVAHNDNDKTVYWQYPLPGTEEAARLLRLHNLIIEIIEASEEYQSLPEARGAYH